MTTKRKDDVNVDQDEPVQAAEVREPTGADSGDERDATIAALKAELEQLRATPAGASAELAKAFAALKADVERMQSGRGLIPVPEPTEPDPYLYWARLGNGDVIEVQHPNATHHYTESHGLVPIEAVWSKEPAQV